MSKHKFLVDTEKICVMKNCYLAVRLQSKRIGEWCREIREERLQGTVNGFIRTLCLASLSVVPLLKVNG